METLTDTQKKIALALIDWALEHKDGDAGDMVIPEDELAKQIGATSWKRENAEDLNVLCSYCARKEYPMVPLLVVIPGLANPKRASSSTRSRQRFPPPRRTSAGKMC